MPFDELIERAFPHRLESAPVRANAATVTKTAPKRVEGDSFTVLQNRAESAPAVRRAPMCIAAVEEAIFTNDRGERWLFRRIVPTEG